MTLKIFLTLTLFLGMTQSLSLVETLFRHKINAARCQSTCLASDTAEDRSQCEEVCGILQRDPEAGQDLCSLTSMCDGGCRAACDAQVTRSRDTVTSITDVRMESCELSWDLVTEASGNVVFVVAGRDQAGMWSLVRDAVTNTKLELSVALAARMVEIVVFAVKGERVDRVSLDISSNTCEETVPEPREWRDEEDMEDMEEEEVNTVSYVLLVTIILATISVIIALVIVTVIIVKMRRARTLREAAHHYETIPYPTYTFPSPKRAQDNFYLESPNTNSFILNLEEAGRDNYYSEKLQAPRLMTTIIEEDEYEEVY